MTDDAIEEVRRAVADCIPGDAILRVHSVARRIAARVGGEGVTVEAVAKCLVDAAMAARIPVELDKVSVNP